MHDLGSIINLRKYIESDYCILIHFSLLLNLIRLAYNIDKVKANYNSKICNHFFVAER